MPSIRFSVPMFYSFYPFAQSPFAPPSSFFDGSDNFYQAMFPFESIYSNLLPTTEEIDNNPFSFDNIYSNMFPFENLYPGMQPFMPLSPNHFFWEFNF